ARRSLLQAPPTRGLICMARVHLRQEGRPNMRNIKLVVALTLLLAFAVPASYAFAASDEGTQDVALPTITDASAVDPATPEATADVEVHAAQYGGCYYYAFYGYYCPSGIQYYNPS